MLSKFPNSTLKIGAPVSLSPDSRYITGGEGAGPGPSNPVGMRGVVEDRYGSTICVRWDNSFTNSYRQDDFDLIAEGEPGFMEVE